MRRLQRTIGIFHEYGVEAKRSASVQLIDSPSATSKKNVPWLRPQLRRPRGTYVHSLAPDVDRPAIVYYISSTLSRQLTTYKASRNETALALITSTSPVA